MKKGLNVTMIGEVGVERILLTTSTKRLFKNILHGLFNLRVFYVFQNTLKHFGLIGLPKSKIF